MGTSAVHVVWDDDHRSEFANRFLRDHCPCAACRDRGRKTLPVVGGREAEVYPVRINVVGRYALSIEWSDGHDTGIYSYSTLRQLCPCELCQASRPGENGGTG